MGGLADGTMEIDPATRRNLELVRSLDGRRDGSLLATVDLALPISYATADGAVLLTIPTGARFKLAQYVRAAAVITPSLSSKGVSPHRFRHATAVHLVAAGVDVTVIRSWLGHVHLDTTNHYAQANLETKRQALERLDPSVVDENDPVASDPDLDLFSREAPFDADFVARYRAAQEARNHAITDWAEAELARIRKAGFSDRPFAVQRTWADPRMVDPTLEPTNREPNMCYAGVPVQANRSARGIAAACTVRNWLGMWSLRTAKTRAEPHLARIDVPALVINADADTGVFPSDARRIHDALASTDKGLCAIDSDHYFTTPGARDEQADTIAEWIAARWNTNQH